MTNREHVCSRRVKNQRPLKLAIDSMERQHPVATSVLYEPTTYVYAEMPHCSLTRLNDSANATLLLYKDILLLFLSFFFSALDGQSCWIRLSVHAKSAFSAVLFSIKLSCQPIASSRAQSSACPSKSCRTATIKTLIPNAQHYCKPPQH